MNIPISQGSLVAMVLNGHQCTSLHSILGVEGRCKLGLPESISDVGLHALRPGPEMQPALQSQLLL